MSKVRSIGPEGLPTPFCDHVLVAPVQDGFQATGACLVDREVHRLSAPVRASYDDALREALAWSDAHALEEVLVVRAANNPEDTA